MKKSFYLTLVALLSIHASSAQKDYKGGFGFGCLSFGSVSTQNLNALVGYSQNISPVVSSGGGAGFAYINQWVIGGSGTGNAGAVFTFNGIDYKLTHGWGGLELGYDFSNNIKNKFIATLFMGGRGTNLTVLKGSDKDKAFDNGAPMFGANFYALKFLISKQQDDAKAIGGLMLGLKIGAQISVSSSDWKYNGSMPYNKVSYAPYGINVGITIGGGGFGKEQ